MNVTGIHKVVEAVRSTRDIGVDLCLRREVIEHFLEPVVVAVEI